MTAVTTPTPIPPTEMTKSHGDYSIGWICALPKEQTAAISMLDVRHPDLSQSPSDKNTYTLGSIGGHNIVICCLPMGIIGTNPAANVATSLIHTFPAIKFGLMVGIGGGIPPKIRLGDIVVSTPISQYPGVVQWDKGKAHSDGEFERIGALNSPPTILLTALTKFQSEHALRRTQIPHHVAQLRSQHPELVPAFDTMEDICFRSDYAHVSIGDENDDCRLCDRANVVHIEPRKGMRIFYGLIASGNQVIKDASSRDQLNARLGSQVLCVEMEAAGLMNTFPCLVIRGICDYADSHKNKRWQEYAAAVAAAFTKELLGFVQPNEVHKERPAKDVSHLVERIGIRIDCDNEKNILKWVGGTTYSKEQDTNLQKRHPGTGEWFLQSNKFKTWLDQSQQTLFCPGLPGAGKTTLASIVVDHIYSNRHRTDQSTIGVAHVYFQHNRRDEQAFYQVLNSILAQLLRSIKPLPGFIKDLYEEIGTEEQMPHSTIKGALEETVSLFSRVYIILDGLDESDKSEASWVLTYLFKLQSKTGANILATSRFDMEISGRFEQVSCLSLEVRAQEDDIKKYLQDNVSRLPFVVRRNPQLQETIISDISDIVDGMFILARVYLDSLKDKMNANAVRKELKKFRNRGIESEKDKIKVLGMAYDDTVQRIKAQLPGRHELAMRILFLLTYAQRRLSLSELLDALAVSVTERTLDSDNVASIEDMVDVCAGLVARAGDGSIEFIHYTTQEYFTSNRNALFSSKEQDMGDLCVFYLSLDHFETGYCDKKSLFRERLRTYPFYDYSAKFWSKHISDCAENKLLIEFLKHNNKSTASSQALDASPIVWPFVTAAVFPSKASGLHLATLFSLQNVVDCLLKDGTYEVDIADSNGATPLFYAVRKEHEGIAKALLEKGADPNIQDRASWSPLLYAATIGHWSIVRLLLDKGVSVDVTEQTGRTALHYAAGQGYGDVVELLLEQGASVDKADNYKRTALMAAADTGSVAIVDCLLKHHANVSQSDSFGQTALDFANKNGNITMTELLEKRLKGPVKSNATCFVSPNTLLGEDVTIGIGSNIDQHVVIGAKTRMDTEVRIHAEAIICARCNIGSRAVIGHHARIGVSRPPRMGFNSSQSRSNANEEHSNARHGGTFVRNDEPKRRRVDIQVIRGFFTASIARGFQKVYKDKQLGK